MKSKYGLRDVEEMYMGWYTMKIKNRKLNYSKFFCFIHHFFLHPSFPPIYVH